MEYSPSRLISDNPTVNLTFDQAKLFNERFHDGWENWVQNAPPAWTQDKWFRNREPVGLISRYGQNHHIECSGEAMRMQKAQWVDMKDFPNACNISWAGATHMEYV
jgi:hypothetical protein